MRPPCLLALVVLGVVATVLVVGVAGRGDGNPAVLVLTEPRTEYAMAAAGATATATPDPDDVPELDPEPLPEAEPPPDTDPPPPPEPEPSPAPAPAPVAARPRHTGPAQVIDRGGTTRRAVALTFDAGADRGYAESILDELRRQGVRASFGMTGLWARANPDLLLRMAAEGHQLMNHSYDHDSFTGLSTGRGPQTAAQRAWQLQTTETIINDLTGATTLPYFRSPYGDTDSTVLRDIGANGYAYNVLWTVDSRGWLRYTAGQIIQRCLAQASPGAIYVFHVGAQSQDGPALPAIIAGLRDLGYTFETVDEILHP